MGGLGYNHSGLTSSARSSLDVGQRSGRAALGPDEGFGPGFICSASKKQTCIMEHEILVIQDKDL